MTVVYDTSSHRQWPQANHATSLTLEEKFEVLKEIGDGSFGSVYLARVRTAGANVARRGTLVAVKTMKKTFESFGHCMELREVIFLRTLPPHPHLVPALDIFLDPMSKKLHIAMEYMDGNLYQLMKARDHKPLDGSSVKSVLFQIISGLEHIHANQFFHRDIKPENILVSSSAPQDTSSTFRRYSTLVTPPSTPPAYTIKIADFGLARETHSKLAYTTYVSTRWYRAPEVLLRAGEYSAPVDIWAVGAMAVEIATLKPLFPGGNEVDQVWRICEIMGSPGGWINKTGARVGGGEWKDGVKLAQKLGFSFPKMAPHSLDTILRAPQWPAVLSEFVTWCLMWDPKSRPTSSQALAHEYFRDAADPLRPKSSSRLLGRKQSNLSTAESHKDSESMSTLTSKTSSWFRKSLIQREASAPAMVLQQPPAPAVQPAQPVQPAHRPAALHSNTVDGSTNALKVRDNQIKRATWTNGLPANVAPIPILPSIRPVSPLSHAVTAQATARNLQVQDKSKKVGRQLSVASGGNHYAELHRQEAEKALSSQSGLVSPTSGGGGSGQKEGFFSHLRKRARRFSGRYQTPMSPNADDIEASAGRAPWPSSNRHSTILDSMLTGASDSKSGLSDLDKAGRSSLEGPHPPVQSPSYQKGSRISSSVLLKRHNSNGNTMGNNNSRTRKGSHKHSQPNLRYETPDEEEELLDEALASVRAATRLDKPNGKTTHHIGQGRQANYQSLLDQPTPHSYLTPASSANRSSVNYGHTDYLSTTKPVDILKPRNTQNDFTTKWPTPPYEESEWAASAAASILAAQAAYR